MAAAKSGEGTRGAELSALVLEASFVRDLLRRKDIGLAADADALLLRDSDAAAHCSWSAREAAPTIAAGIRPLLDATGAHGRRSSRQLLDESVVVPPDRVSTLDLAALALNGVYRRKLWLRVGDDIRAVALSTGSASMLLVAGGVAAGYAGPVAGQAVSIWPIACLLVLTGRAWAYRREASWRCEGVSARRTLIVGSGRVARITAERLLETPELGLQPIGFLDKEPMGADELPLPVLGASWDLEDVVRAGRVQQGVFCFSTAPGEVGIRLIENCERLGVDVLVVPRFFEKTGARISGRAHRRAPPHERQPAVCSLIRARSQTRRRPDRRGWPPAPGSSAPPRDLSSCPPLRRASNPSPPDACRPGRRALRDAEFRSMKMERVSAADPAVPELDAGTAPGGVPGADRRTRLGVFLRRTSLHELPQLLNVLRGEMSLVRPRPERPEFVRLFETSVHGYSRRHRVRGGITGWAQIHRLRGKTSISQRTEWGQLVHRQLVAVARSQDHRGDGEAAASVAHSRVWARPLMQATTTRAWSDATTHLSSEAAHDLEAPEVTIVMPVRNEVATLEGALRDVLAQSVDTSFEVIVVDGESTDGTRQRAERLASEDPRIRIVANPARRTAPALNAGLRAARGRFVIRVDGHSRIPPDYVARLVAHLRSEACEGVGGIKRPVARTAFGKGAAAAWASPFGIGGSPNRGATKAAYVDHVPFGAYVTERARAVGGWNERFVRNEDAEFDYRYVEAGGRLLLDPSIDVAWHVRETPAALARQYYEYGFWRFQTLVRHPARFHPRWLAPPALLLGLLTSGVLRWRRPAALRLHKALLASYGSVLAAGAADAGRSTGIGVAPHTALALVTIHAAWGAGFIAGAGAHFTRRLKRRE